MYKIFIKWLKFPILRHLRNLLCIVSKLMWNEHLILVCNLTRRARTLRPQQPPCFSGKHTSYSNAWTAHQNQQCLIYNCVFTYSREGVKIILLELFCSHTLQLHLLLAVNNTIQHYKLSIHSDLAFCSNWSNLNSCKPKLVLWLFPRYSSPHFLLWCHRLFFRALSVTACLLFKCNLNQEKGNAVYRPTMVSMDLGGR